MLEHKQITKLNFIGTGLPGTARADHSFILELPRQHESHVIL